MNIDTPAGLQQAKDWLQGHLARLTPGGTWIIPRSKTIYQLNRETKLAVRLIGPGDPTTEKVMGELGWTVQINNERTEHHGS